MPAPRAVLADIHDLGLDPNRSHDHINGSSGRLRSPDSEETLVKSKPQPKVVEKKEKLAIEETVQDLDDSDLEVTVEPVVEEKKTDEKPKKEEKFESQNKSSSKKSSSKK